MPTFNFEVKSGGLVRMSKGSTPENVVADFHVSASLMLCCYAPLLASEEQLKVAGKLMARHRTAHIMKSGRQIRPFHHIENDDVLLFSVSGSKLYNLDLPTSDEDLVMCYRRRSYKVHVLTFLCKKVCAPLSDFFSNPHTPH